MHSGCSVEPGDRLRRAEGACVARGRGWRAPCTWGGAGTGAGDPLPTQMGPFGGPGGSALVSLKASVEAQCA